MGYRVPEEYINRRDVQIFICGLSNNVHISFSRRLEDEFSKWPKRKVRDIISDIQTDLSYSVVFEPIWPESLDYIYERVYVTLRQVY